MAGKSTGVITTTRITHATPAAAYASSSSRYWESNENTPKGCDDIAHQLIHGEIGSNLDVIFGGGRRHFLPDGAGLRTDNRNLIDEYVIKQSSLNKRALVVHNRVR
jgi:alkaline phosphatase